MGPQTPQKYALIPKYIMFLGRFYDGLLAIVGVAAISTDFAGEKASLGGR